MADNKKPFIGAVNNTFLNLAIMAQMERPREYVVIGVKPDGQADFIKVCNDQGVAGQSAESAIGLGVYKRVTIYLAYAEYRP